MENVKVGEVWKSAEPVDQAQLLNNVKFQNAIVTNIFFRQYMIAEYFRQRRKVLELIAAIEKYLGEEK
jgi:hypothetical protein